MNEDKSVAEQVRAQQKIEKYALDMKKYAVRYKPVRPLSFIGK